jgi:hypothetical protein
MSARFSSEMDKELERHDAVRPEWWASHPNCAGIDVECTNPRDGRVLVYYRGWATDLIAVGVMTESMLQPTGKHLRDADGDRVTVTRSWREENGQPRRWCQVLRIKPTAAALGLPGARAALTALDQFQKWQQRRQAIVSQRCDSRPNLYLVVDNSQGRLQ